MTLARRLERQSALSFHHHVHRRLSQEGAFKLLHAHPQVLLDYGPAIWLGDCTRYDAIPAITVNLGFSRPSSRALTTTQSPCSVLYAQHIHFFSYSKFEHPEHYGLARK